MHRIQNRLALLILSLPLLGLLASPPPARAEVPATLCGSGGCEYLVNHFSGQYPAQRKRKHWTCFDQTTKASVACANVRGADIRRYSDVYRPRDTRNTIGPDTLCMLRGGLNCDKLK